MRDIEVNEGDLFGNAVEITGRRKASRSQPTRST